MNWIARKDISLFEWVRDNSWWIDLSVRKAFGAIFGKSTIWVQWVFAMVFPPYHRRHRCLYHCLHHCHWSQLVAHIGSVHSIGKWPVCQTRRRWWWRMFFPSRKPYNTHTARDNNDGKTTATNRSFLKSTECTYLTINCRRSLNELKVWKRGSKPERLFRAQTRDKATPCVCYAFVFRKQHNA